MPIADREQIQDYLARVVREQEQAVVAEGSRWLESLSVEQRAEELRRILTGGPGEPEEDYPMPDLELSTEQIGGFTMSNVPEVIQAQAFQVVDSDGNVRGSFAASGVGPCLHLYDETGEVRTELMLAGDGHTFLRLYDAAGKYCAALTVAKDGYVTLALLDGKGGILWKAPTAGNAE